MPSLDTNQWYKLHVASEDSSYSLWAGAGSVTFTNATEGNGLLSFEWQFYPFNDTYYIIRSNGVGADLGMTTFNGTDVFGGAVPNMSNITTADSSKFWAITPWGDGTFYLTNPLNTPSWHLAVRPSTGGNTILLAMDSNITGTQDEQRFTFSAVSAIDNSAFSTVEITTAASTSTITTATATFSTSSSASPTTTSTSTSTSSSTTTSIPIPTTQTSSTTPTTSSSSLTQKSTLSAGVYVAIGVSVTAGLVFLSALIFFLLRRRRRRQLQDMKKDGPYNETPLQEVYVKQPAELHDKSTVEMYVQPAEVQGSGGCGEAWELDGGGR